MLLSHLPKIMKKKTPDTRDTDGEANELISDVLLWTPTHGCASVGRPARTYIQQLCEDTGCNPENLPEAMMKKWRTGNPRRRRDIDDDDDKIMKKKKTQKNKDPDEKKNNIPR